MVACTCHFSSLLAAIATQLVVLSAAEESSADSVAATDELFGSSDRNRAKLF